MTLNRVSFKKGDEIMQCPRCHHELQEDMQFCPHCGLKLERCPVCHAPVLPQAKFCTYCGTSLHQEEDNGYYQPIQDVEVEKKATDFHDIPVKKKVNKKVIIISVTILAVVSIASFWYLHYGPVLTNGITQPNQQESLPEDQDIQVSGETSESSMIGNLNQNGLAAMSNDKLFICDAQNRLVMMDKDLSNQQTIVNEEVNYVQVVDNLVYYTDARHRMCSIDTNGQNQKVILDKAIYYLVIEDQKAYYQLDEDNESIYVYDFQTRKETKLNDRASYELNVIDNTIYYSSTDGIYRISTDGKGDEKLVGGKVFNLIYQNQKLYYTSQSDVNIKVYDIQTQKEDTLINERSQLLNITSDYLFYQTSDMQINRYDIKSNKLTTGLYSGNVSGVFVIGDKLILNTVSSISDKNNYKVIMDFSGDHQRRLFLNDSGEYI